MGLTAGQTYANFQSLPLFRGNTSNDLKPMLKQLDELTGDADLTYKKTDDRPYSKSVFYYFTAQRQERDGTIQDVDVLVECNKKNGQYTISIGGDEFNQGTPNNRTYTSNHNLSPLSLTGGSPIHYATFKHNAQGPFDGFQIKDGVPEFYEDPNAAFGRLAQFRGYDTSPYINKK